MKKGRTVIRTSLRGSRLLQFQAQVFYLRLKFTNSPFHSTLTLLKRYIIEERAIIKGNRR